MKICNSRIRVGFCVGAGLLAIGSVAAHADTFEGYSDYTGLWQGPAQFTANDNLVTPANFTGGWHYHPGYVYNVVIQGSVIVEDGCGGTVEYGPGDAFEKADGRVHRAINPYDEDEIEFSMSINAPGSPGRVSVPAGTCGPANHVDECKADGWRSFNHPYRFKSQGDCIAYVNDRPRVTLLVPEDPPL